MRRPLFMAATLTLAALAAPLSSQAAAACGDPGRPTCVIIRPDAPAAPSPADQLSPECVISVGGFGSDNNDGTFDDVLAWTEDESSYRTYRLGRDRSERYPYDTLGPIELSGYALRGLARELATECRAIDIVTHSMGGAVADRAFSLGLSSRDRVATYVALSSPHNGATLAKALQRPMEADPLMALEISTLARSLDQPDPTSPAGRDLALIDKAPRLPRVDARLRLRLATDAMVLERDNRDRRLDVRVHLPSLDELEGHGGILKAGVIRQSVHETITSHAVAADPRSGLERVIATWVSDEVDHRLASIYYGLSQHLIEQPFGAIELAVAYAATRVPQAIAAALDEARALFLVVEPLPLVVVP